MSELTECNHCSLKAIQRRADKQDKEVLVVSAPKFSFDKGVEVFTVPKGFDPEQLSDIPTRDKYFCCWFAELSERCVC